MLTAWRWWTATHSGSHRGMSSAPASRSLGEDDMHYANAACVWSRWLAGLAFDARERSTDACCDPGKGGRGSVRHGRRGRSGYWTSRRISVVRHSEEALLSTATPGVPDRVAPALC